MSYHTNCDYDNQETMTHTIRWTRTTCLTWLLNFHVFLIDTQLTITLSIGTTRHSIDNFHVMIHKTIYIRRYAQCNVTFQAPLCSSTTQYPCLIRHFDIADYTGRSHISRGPIAARAFERLVSIEVVCSCGSVRSIPPSSRIARSIV